MIILFLIKFPLIKARKLFIIFISYLIQKRLRQIVAKLNLKKVAERKNKDHRIPAFKNDLKFKTSWHLYTGLFNSSNHLFFLSNSRWQTNKECPYIDPTTEIWSAELNVML